MLSASATMPDFGGGPLSTASEEMLCLIEDGTAAVETPDVVVLCFRFSIIVVVGLNSSST